MKKSYFLMAAAAALFAACAETDFVNEATVQDAPKAIGFETFSNKATRHSTATTMNTYHENFGVYGYNDDAARFSFFLLFLSAPGWMRLRC